MDVNNLRKVRRLFGEILSCLSQGMRKATGGQEIIPPRPSFINLQASQGFFFSILEDKENVEMLEAHLVGNGTCSAACDLSSVSLLRLGMER